MSPPMGFLSVAERELRAAARRGRTYFVRWVTGFAFFGLLIWLFWALDGFRNRTAAPEVFQVISVLTFFYALFIGSTVTADCISSEKREGTLGLLFLTNLNSFEIILGKLCSSSLVTIYSLFSVFPMLAVLFMFGGIALDLFWHTVLALVNAIFFGVAVGFLASVFCVRQFTAIALASGLTVILGAGLMGVAAALDALRGVRIWVDTLALACPLYGLLASGGNRVFGRNHYWLSLGLVACFSVACLLLAGWQLARRWQDRPKRMPLFRSSIPERWRAAGASGRANLRRRLLDWNPFFWLASRQRVSSPVFMVLTVVLMILAIYVATPFFNRLFRGGSGGWEGFAFSWLWLGIGLHALVLYYAAMIASQRVAEDKQSGVFELIFSTPVTERLISRGFWLAYWRRLFFPALAATLVHLFFIWLGATFLKLQLDEIPDDMAVGQFLWRALWKLPITGGREDWSFWYALRVFLLALVLFAGVWLTLGWLGRWLGLRMKHPGFAPLTALAFVIVPPVLIFTIVCIVGEETRFFRRPDRVVVPVMIWTAFGIGVLHCLLLSRWAAVRLHRDFRSTVIGQVNVPRPRFWWIPSWRVVVRYLAWASAIVVVAALLVMGFYGYQNHRSCRNWTSFQQALAQKGESLDITPLIPPPVPDAANFAKAAAFRRFSATNPTTKRLFDKLKRWEGPANYGSTDTYEWSGQRFAPLAEYLSLALERVPRGLDTNRHKVGPVLLDGLRVQNEILQDVSVAARFPHFQVSTNRNAMAVLQSDQTAISTLRRLQFLFCVRASALLAADRNQDAADDILTSLRLAQHSRRLPDAESAARTQEMLVRSFQPLWEGLAEYRWNEHQLAAFQEELLKFDPMTDFTNTFRRVVLAHIEVWRAYPDARVQPHSVPIAGNVYLQVDSAFFRHRSSWFDDCIQLYRCGERTMAQIDVAKETVRRTDNWGEFQGLQLGHETEQFLGQRQWWWPKTPASLAFTQNALNQAVIACALERYHIVFETYPETLDQLVPAYLNRIPADVVRGRPMIYQRSEGGRYILRSVGPDEQDGRKTKSADDWLWWYGTNAPVKISPTRN